MLDVRIGKSDNVGVTGSFHDLGSGYQMIYHLGKILYRTRSVAIQGVNSPYYDDGFDHHYHILGYPPQVSGANFELALLPYNQYLDYVAHIKAFFDGTWNFRGRPGELTHQENPVSHSSLRGAVVENDLNRFLNPGGLESGGTHSLPTKFSIYSMGESSVLSTIDSDIYNSSGLSEMHNALSSTKAAVGFGGSWDKSNPSSTVLRYIVPVFDYYIRDDAICIKYAQYTIKKPSNGQYLHYIAFTHILIRNAYTTLEPEYGEIYNIEDALQLCWYNSFVTHYSANRPNATTYWSGSGAPAAYAGYDVSFTNSNPWAGTSATFYSPYMYFSQRRGYRVTDSLVGYNYQENTFSSNNEYSYKNFLRSIHPLVGDAYAITQLSTVDAIDKYLVNMRINQLEAISDLRSLLGLVDIVQLFQRVRSIKRDIGVSLLRDIIDILSSAELAWSFSVRPTISDTEKIVDKAQSFRRRYYGKNSLFTFNTIYGKTQLDDIGDFFGVFQDMTLTVRSKVRLRFADDSLLAYAMPYRSLGILPSLSAVWEIIPFSFVVDWIFPVNDHLSMADLSHLFSCLELDLSVHSILYEYEFPDDILIEHGIDRLEGSDSDGIVYRYYDRFPLDRLPIAAPSRLTSDISPSFPDWETVGSLIYQLTK